MERISYSPETLFHVLTHFETADEALRDSLRNGCPVRTVRTSRTISTGACQLILERTGEAGYALRTLFPGELAPPLPLPGQVPDPFWATHLLIEFN